MKKLIIGILFLGMWSTAVQAQYGRTNNGSNSREYDNSRYDSRNRQGHRYNKGRNYNRNSKASQINSYQRMALEKIRQGQSRGLLTRRESARLMRSYNDIARKENRYLRNGRLSNREQRDLKQDLDRLNHRINKESRDFQRNRRRRF